MAHPWLMERTLPALRPLNWWLAWRIANLTAIALLFLFWMDKGLLHPHLTSDGAAYWGSGDGVLYEYRWLSELDGLPHPFVYSPAFAQAIWPLTRLSLEVFMAVWVGLQVALLAWLVPPALAVVLLLWPPLGLNDLWAGSVYIPMTAALALSLRYPAAWAFQALTKVTPGIGIIWHLVRGEWRALAWALGTTLTVVAMSFAVWPAAWVGWLELLRGSVGQQSPDGFQVPLLARLPVAAMLIGLAARRDWRWLLPVGVILALPQIGWSSAALLLAVPRLRRAKELR